MCNAFFASFLILHIFINVSYSDEIENRPLNGESTSLESCKYQLGTNTTECKWKLSIGAVYIRWGRTSCGNSSDLIYTGQVGGGYCTHSGTSVNRICLPNDPDTAQPIRVHTSYLYGAVYELFNYNTPNSMKDGLGNHDIPCAVCFAKGKMSSLMIPGRKRCYKEWTQEYNGIMMSGLYMHKSSSEYLCVDTDAEALPGGSQDQDGVLFYPVRTQCGFLKCPPYSHETDVPCVVCTK